MAIGRISGPMLFSNLERQGVDLSVETDLLYIDVTNDRIGIRTSVPTSELSVSGNIDSTNLSVSGNVTAVAGLFPSANNSGVVGNTTSSWADGTFTNLTVSNTITVRGNVDLADGDSLRFGTGDDMLVYHSSDQNVVELVTGNLNIRNSSDFTGVYRVTIERSGNISASGTISSGGNFASLTGNIALLGNVTANTGTVTFSNVVSTSANIGNLRTSNNAITSINTDGNIQLDPNGQGYVISTGTNGIIIPIGTSEQRPENPPEGVLRYNTSISHIEFFDGLDWRRAGPELAQVQLQTLVGDGSTAAFTLFREASAAGLLVSINGTVQKPTTSYTVVGTTITFAEPPQIGDSIDIRYLSIAYDFSSPTLASYTRAEVLALEGMAPGDIVYVTDGVAGGPSIAFYTGSSWDFIQDNELMVSYPSSGIPVSTGTAWGTSKAAPVGDLVGTTDSQILTGKTLSNAVYSGTVDVQGSVRHTINSVSTSAVDCSSGNYFTKTVNGDTVFTFTSAPASRAYSFTLEINHVSGIITWPNTVRWPNATPPSLVTGKVHLFTFATSNGGSVWRASANVNYDS